MLDKECVTLQILLLAERLLHCVCIWCEDEVECKVSASDKDADMNVVVACASNLMWHQPERGGWFVHSVITAAGHRIASVDGTRKEVYRTCLMSPFGRTRLKLTFFSLILMTNSLKREKKIKVKIKEKFKKWRKSVFIKRRIMQPEKIPFPLFSTVFCPFCYKFSVAALSIAGGQKLCYLRLQELPLVRTVIQSPPKKI